MDTSSNLIDNKYKQDMNDWLKKFVTEGFTEVLSGKCKATNFELMFEQLTVKHMPACRRIVKEAREREEFLSLSNGPVRRQRDD